MPVLRSVPDSTQPPSAPGAPGTSAAGRRPVRRRFWLLLALTLAACLVLSPAPWRLLLGMALRWEVERHGGKLTIGRMEGGPFDTFQLYDVRCRQAGEVPPGAVGTDFRVARVDLTLDWSFLRRGRNRPWLRQVVLEGLTGRYDLGGGRKGSGALGAEPPASWLSRHASRLVPAGFFVRAGDFAVQRGAYRLHVRRLRLTGERGTPGFLLAREVEIGGPGFQNTFLNRHGKTLWQSNRLTVTDLELTPGVELASVMVDGAHLDRRRLDWDGTLTVLGGEVRAQGAVNLSRARLGLDVAGTLRALPVQSLARLLGLMGAAGGSIEQGNFSFHGDPEDWASADLWLAVQARDFLWKRRHWESLELQTVVLHRRAQVNRLELRQGRNQLSAHGDFAFPANDANGRPAWTNHWWEAGFSCQVDAKLEDLQSFAVLAGPHFPALVGRTSVNGTLEARPGGTGIDGYLNVEGSQWVIRGAPLDYLRTTLLFKDGLMQVADLQATHGGDYLSGRWTARLTGAADYRGELKVVIKDRALYTPALDGVVDLGRAGLASEDPHAPIQVDGTFQGPGQQGEIVFQPKANSTEPVRLPAPAVGEWWRDD